MADLSEQQQIVFDRAKEILQRQKWYTGVCMDNFPTDNSIALNGTDHAVDEVVLNTAFWDAPQMGFAPDAWTD